MAQGKTSKIMRKLNYLNDTKALVKQAMQNKGLEVPSDLRFREYADLINNLELKADETDATVLATDIAYGKVAYNNNNRVVGTIPEIYDFTFNARFVEDDAENEVVTGIAYLDRRVITRNDKNKIKVKINYFNIESYNTTLQKLNNLLGE